MNKCNTLGCKVALVVSIACLPGISKAATAVSDNFDTDIGSWIGNTSNTSISHVATGGNPGGYLETTSTARNVLGAVNLAPDYSGVFADGTWTLKVDLSFISGTYSDARLRYRYQDSTSNGWHISLEKSNFSTDWTNYSVIFDTSWDDATAIANGWRKEIDGTTATPHFSELWNNVYTSEVRLIAGAGAVAGIDNYMATIVPVPAAAWLFGSGLIGLIGIARRKKA